MSTKSLVRFTDPGAFNSLVLFQVKVSGTFTVPTTKTGTSPSGSAFNTVQQVVGGQLLAGASDAASGTAGAFDLTDKVVCDLWPGDVVAMSAVSSSVVTVTVTSVDGTVRTYQFATTTTACVIGYYG